MLRIIKLFLWAALAASPFIISDLIPTPRADPIEGENGTWIRDGHTNEPMYFMYWDEIPDIEEGPRPDFYHFIKAYDEQDE